MGKDKSAKRNKKTGKLKARKIGDLPARADRERSIKGGTVWGSPRVLPIRTES